MGLLSKNSLLRLEHIFTVFSLLFFTEGVFRLVLTGGANQGDGAKYDASLVQLISICIYAITFALLCMRWKKVLMYVSRDRWILPLILFAIASMIWSDAPALTFRRSFALVGTSLFGVYLATRYTIRQQVALLGWMFGIAILLSVLFIIIPPQYGISGGVHSGAWRGIWSHKNGLAQKMAIAANVFLILSLSTRQKRWLPCVLLSMAVLLEVMARSTAGLLAMAITMMILPLVQAFRWRSRFMIPAVIGIISASSLILISLFYGAETVLAFFGEDTSLTGRADFWPIVIDKIQEQPLLGYGYEAFWRGFEGPSADIAYATMTGFIPTHAHNGILQLWLHLGFIGVFLFLVGLWTTILKSITFIRVSDSFEGLWPLLYCSLVILFNLSESVILEYNQIVWVIYIAVSLSVLRLPERSEPHTDQSSSLSA
ncbi:MAG: O-antigen ligase [Cyanobacteria bacterium P01_E01_bin.6]